MWSRPSEVLPHQHLQSFPNRLVMAGAEMSAETTWLVAHHWWLSTVSTGEAPGLSREAQSGPSSRVMGVLRQRVQAGTGNWEALLCGSSVLFSQSRGRDLI